MASLLIAAGIATHQKIQSSREKKREKKRQEFARRYSELEGEHENYEKKYMDKQSTGESSNGKSLNPFFDQDGLAEKRERRSSEDSQRSWKEAGDGDGPEQWVDGVVKERSKTGQDDGGVPRERYRTNSNLDEKQRSGTRERMNGVVEGRGKH